MDSLSTKQVCMFYIISWEYIISYKLMSQNQIPSGLDIDLFNNISVARIDNTVK